jgi:hypothetical protein
MGTSSFQPQGGFQQMLKPTGMVKSPLQRLLAGLGSFRQFLRQAGDKRLLQSFALRPCAGRGHCVGQPRGHRAKPGHHLVGIDADFSGEFLPLARTDVAQAISIDDNTKMLLIADICR